jgi:peptide/nickel transport system permease protein
MPLLRRLAFAPIVLLVVAAVTYGTPRILRPDLFQGEAFIPGLARQLERVFLHLDFGCAGILPGCPSIHDLWVSGLVWDLWLLAGALVIGVPAGILAGIWCARRPRSLAARAVEAAALTAYCAPVFFVGLFLLWLFNPIYGRVPLSAFFDAEPHWIVPWDSPWDWFRMLLVPWLVLAAPLAAMCLRLTLSETREAMDEDFVRTASAKGIRPTAVVRRHAAPLSFPGHVLVRRRVGAADRHEHGARRARLLGARVLQVHVAGGGPRELGPRTDPRLPAAVRARAVGRGAADRARPDRRRRRVSDRSARAHVVRAGVVSVPRG